MLAPTHRILVVADATESRQQIARLLRDLVVEAYWLNDASELIDHAWWSQPKLILIAMRDPQEAHATYARLQAWLGEAPVRVVVLGTANDGAPVPHRRRRVWDCYLPPEPTLHELAWQVQQCVQPPRGLYARLGRAATRRMR